MKLGLVLAGGGGKGSYEIGVWKYLREIGLDKDIAVISGTSVGGLNAALMTTVEFKVAQYIWENETEELILDSTSETHRTGAVFSRNGLLKIIDRHIDLSKFKNSRIKTYVTCFNKTKIKSESFCLNNYDSETIKKLLCATSAIPIAFQEEKIFGNSYIDGGVKDNVPLIPLLEEHCTHAIIVNLNDDYSDYSGYDIKIIDIHPSSNLGSFVSGTMDFSPERIARRIETGYIDCKAMYHLQLKTLMEDYMNSDELIRKADRINDMNDNHVFLETLKLLCINPQDRNRIHGNENILSNKTMGGRIFWKTISQYNGWKVQEHFTGWVRIIDYSNNFVAWSTSRETFVNICKQYLIQKLKEV